MINITAVAYISHGSSIGSAINRLVVLETGGILAIGRRDSVAAGRWRGRLMLRMGGRCGVAL